LKAALGRIFAGIPWGKGRFATRWGGDDYPCR